MALKRHGFGRAVSLLISTFGAAGSRALSKRNRLSRTLIERDEELPLDKFFGVGHKFWIGIGAEFVQIHALAFAVHYHPLRVEAI